MSMSPESAGKAIVRGGLLPQAAIEEHILIRLRNREIPVKDRVDYVILMLTTFCETREQEEGEPVFWHRLLGSTIVQVGTE